MSETYRSTDLRFIGLLPVLTLKKRAACSASRSTFSTFTSCSSICAYTFLLNVERSVVISVYIKVFDMMSITSLRTFS